MIFGNYISMDVSILTNDSIELSLVANCLSKDSNSSRFFSGISIELLLSIIVFISCDESLPFIASKISLDLLFRSYKILLCVEIRRVFICSRSRISERIHEL